MKIFISLPYFPLPGTGTGNAVYGFAKGLISANAEVCVLAEGDKYEKTKYKEVPYIKFLKKKTINPLYVSKNLLNYIEESDVDLVILNGIYVPYMYVLSRKLKRLKIPYIHLPHSVYNDISLTKSKFKKKIYLKLFEKNLIEDSLAIQMLSESQIDAVKKFSTPKNIISLPNGIEIEKHDIKEKIYTNSSNPTKIIFLGRKDLFTKGLDLLIEAFSKIKNKNVELYIQGSDTKDTDTLNKIINDLNAKNISLKEPFNGDVVNYLKEYDLMIMPSRYEAFSMAVIEGMLAGLPIIVSTEVGAALHVKKAKSGILCNATVDDVYSAIDEMLNREDEWEEMGRNAQKYLLENLTWDIIGMKAIAHYEHLLKNKKAI